MVSGSGGANHLSSGGPSPAGGVADNVSVSNPFDDGSPSPTSRGGQYAGGPHPPYPSNAGPRPPNYTGQGYGQYSGSGGPPDQYSPYPGSPGYPPARPGYPPYGGDSAGGTPNSSQGAHPGQDPYSRYNISGAPAAGYPPRPSYGTAPGTSGAPASQPPGGPYPTQQDYYRPDQVSYYIFLAPLSNFDKQLFIIMVNPAILKKKNKNLFRVYELPSVGKI